MTEHLTPREFAIVKYRILTTPPKTLEEVAAKFNVTRERIRQLQLKTERKLGAAFGEELYVVAETLKEEFGHIAKESAVNRRIDMLISGNVDDTAEYAEKLFRKGLIDQMGFDLHQGVYVDERALEMLEEIRASIRELADEVGLVNEQKAIQSLPDEKWCEFWPWVRQSCKLYELFGSIGIRDTGKARTKAALISFGRPATRKQIARVCGFSEAKVGSHLSVIPGVVRADKSHWGLRKWVDDEYDGITGEIIQRIEEDGGATTTKRLLTELPSKFGVSVTSVNSYMQAAKFVIKEGWISLASKSEIRLRDLDDVIHGRDDIGLPYWTFAVEARYFDGFSVTNVPVEFAKALGCEPDSVAHVWIQNLPDCHDLSVNWRLASISGASLGYVGDSLKCLGLKPGDRARITITGHDVVELTRHVEGGQRTRDGDAREVLDRIIQRRKVL